MKHKILIIIISLIVLALIAGTIIISQKQVDSFKLEDYTQIIEKHPSDKKVGVINNKNDAKKKAAEVWLEQKSTTKNRKIKVYYDKYNDCWYIKGLLKGDRLGWNTNIIIKSNGEVLAMWLE